MKRPISRMASQVQASSTLTIDAIYKKMKADGINVVGFGAGEPDFNTPENIKQAGINAINNNFTKYTPITGIESLRRAICDGIERDVNVRYEPSQIVVSPGAKFSLMLCMHAIINPGDEVILPAPYWVSYFEQIKMSGAQPVIIETKESDGFKFGSDELKAAITPKTKALILNSPSNPSGATLGEKEMSEIAAVCVEHGIYVIADDIYCKLVYDGKKHTSIISFGDEIRDLTMYVNGVSKTYSMTGWRVGYTAANAEIARAMSNYSGHSTSGPSSMAQMAALEAVTGPQDSVEEMRRTFEQRRDFFVKRMNEIEGVSCIKPEGAFYIMMNMESFTGKKMYGTLIRNGDDFSKLLLEKGLVATVPCSGFGAPNHIRFSYAVSMENIKEGLDRLADFIKKS